MPITAAVLAGLGTRRRRRRSLPANVPLTKRRRQQRQRVSSRGLYVTAEEESPRAAHPPARGAHRFLCGPHHHRGRRRDGAHTGCFPGVIRSELSTTPRMPTTAARCRAVMTSQGNPRPVAALLASRGASQPLKATNRARGDYDSRLAARQRPRPCSPSPAGSQATRLRPDTSEGRKGKRTGLSFETYQWVPPAGWLNVVLAARTGPAGGRSPHPQPKLALLPAPCAGKRQRLVTVPTAPS